MLIKLIGYEIYKILKSKFIVISLILLFTVNFALAVYSASETEKAQLPTETVNAFFELYNSILQEIEADYENLMSLMGTSDFKMPENKYSTDDGVTDMALYYRLFTVKDSIDSYQDKIQDVLSKAYTNASLSEKGDYTYRYQARVINTYLHTASEVNMEMEYVYGWEAFFDYYYVNIFIYLSVLLIAIYVIIQEKDTQMVIFLNTSSNGRIKTGIAKILAIVLLNVLTIAVFVLTSWLVFAAVIGFSSPDNALQIISRFIYCPYVLTIGQYFALSTGLKIIGFTLISMTAIVIGAVLKNNIIIYLLNITILGINILMMLFDKTKYVNIIACVFADDLFKKFRAINFFGNVVDTVYFVLIAYVLLIILFAAYLPLFGYRNRTSHKSRNNNSAKDISGSTSLLFYELFKVFSSKRTVILIILLIGIKCIIAFNGFQAIDSYEDTVYHEYMTLLAGELTDEKEDYIINERAYIIGNINQYEEMQTLYLNNDISYEEYMEFMKKYYYSYGRNTCFYSIEKHADYIRSFAEERAVQPHFVYDTGWNLLLNSEFDFVQYLLILMLAAGIFNIEFSGTSSAKGFVQIMRTTHKGRNTTFYTKVTAALIISITVFIIFNAIDIILISYNYDLPCAGSPLVSLQSFSAVRSSISISEYLVMFYCIRLAATILLCTFIIGISALIKKAIPTITIVLAVTLIPKMLVSLGLNVFQITDYTSFMAATPLVLLSASNNFLKGYGLFIIYTLLALLTSVSILIKARKDFIS